jgi:hypothetical protein
MATIQRPVKEGSVRTYQEKVGLGFVDILASEMDADLDTIYAAWNGGADTINIKDGSITYAKLAPDARLWEDTGSTLRPGPSFAARPVTLSSAAQQLILGSGTVKGYVSADAASCSLQSNNPSSPQDVSKSSWQITANAAADGIQFWRRAPGAGPGLTTTPGIVDNTGIHTTGGLCTFGSSAASVVLRIAPRGTIFADNNAVEIDANGVSSLTYDRNGSPTWKLQLLSWSGDGIVFLRRAAGVDTFVQMFQIQNAGNLTIFGPTATKSTGTLWANPSDRRLKDEVEDYATGLAAVLQLQPRTFVYNGKGGSMAGQRGYGFIADEIAPVMPETVGTRAGKLDPADEDETDIQTLDQSNLILALVNAVRELAARLTAVETAPA